MKDRIKENGIEYKLVGDYYISVLELPDEERSIGKYGRMHRQKQQENECKNMDLLPIMWYTNYSKRDL